MIVVGLTGSIGMGKSTAAKMLRRLRVPVFDADACVHGLQRPGGSALPAIETAFPGVVVNNRLDRQALGARIFGDALARAQLECIIHPMVHAAQAQFLRTQSRRRARIVVLDIPLLFEGKGWRKCDAIAVASAPAHVQRQRVLARPGMTAEKFQQILATQIPDAEKRHRADFVIPSGRGYLATLHALQAMLADLNARHRLRYRNHRARSKRRRPSG
jgi:dephospho-CoA kinase